MCNKQEEYLDHVLNQLIRNTKINFPRRTMELPWFHQHNVGCEFVTDISLQNFIANGYEKNDFPSYDDNEETWTKGYGYIATLTKQKLIV